MVAELARRATVDGFEIVALDGRNADVAADGLADALAEPIGGRVVVLDSLELAPALAALIRDVITPGAAHGSCCPAESLPERIGRRVAGMERCRW